jgi:hypothetical protein
LTARLAQGRRLLDARSAWLVTAGLAAGVGAAWLISQAGPSPASVPPVPLALPVAVLVGWSLIGSGLLAARSRREDHLALALIFTGFAWFASMLPNSHNPVLFTAGEIVYSLYYAGFLYLILSFPAGRRLCRSRSRRQASAGTRRRSRRPCTSASWKRCRTSPSTRRHRRRA